MMHFFFLFTRRGLSPKEKKQTGVKRQSWRCKMWWDFHTRRYGQWLKGFTYHIGTCSAYTIELWGIYIGLVMAWNLGYKEIIIESDSQTSILAVSKVDSSNSNG